jgi:hypothetical protein
MVVNSIVAMCYVIDNQYDENNWGIGKCICQYHDKVMYCTSELCTNGFLLGIVNSSRKLKVRFTQFKNVAPAY